MAWQGEISHSVRVGRNAGACVNPLKIFKRRRAFFVFQGRKRLQTDPSEGVCFCIWRQETRAPPRRAAFLLAGQWLRFGYPKIKVKKMLQPDLQNLANPALMVCGNSIRQSGMLITYSGYPFFFHQTFDSLRPPFR